MVVSFSLDHVLSLSYLQIIAGTYNSSGITMRPITAKALWMVSGEILKNLVFRQVKTGRVIVNSAEKLSVAAKKFVPSIATLFKKEKDLLCEPDDINQSLYFPASDLTNT